MDIKEFQLATAKLTQKEVDALIVEIEGIYKDAIADIQAEIDRNYLKYLSNEDPANYYSIMSTHNRLEKLLQYAQGQYNYYAKLINDKITQVSSLSLSNTWYRDQYVNAFMAGISFTVLDPRIIEVSVLGTKESWKNITAALESKYLPASSMAPQYGSLSKDLLDPFKKDTLVKIQKTMTQGFIQGYSNQKMASSIKDLMENALYQAERIARTESTRTSNEADQLSAMEASNQGANIMRMWVSALDDRTRSNHAKLDGQLAPVDKPFKDGPMRPGAWQTVGDNINERCTTVNVVIGPDGTPDIPAFRRGYPPVTDPKTGKKTSQAGKSEVYSMKYFDQWAKENNLKVNKYGEMYAG